MKFQHFPFYLKSFPLRLKRDIQAFKVGFRKALLYKESISKSGRKISSILLTSKKLSTFDILILLVESRKSIISIKFIFVEQTYQLFYKFVFKN